MTGMVTFIACLIDNFDLDGTVLEKIPDVRQKLNFLTL